MNKRGKESLTFDRILLLPDFMDLYKKKDIEKNDTLKQEFEKAFFINQILTTHKNVKYSDEIKEVQLKRLLTRIQSDERSEQRNRPGLWIKIAASAILLIALSILIFKRDLWMLSDKKEPKLEIIVPSGEKSQLILADGTKVWINSESKLTYPLRFKNKERKVILEGEAYFDVSKVKNSQFIVYTQDVKVKVLGTKFNVKSYPKDRTIETTVVEGLVSVEDKEGKARFSPILLKSAERMVFQKDFSDNRSDHIIKELADKTIQKSTPLVSKEILISHVNTENITCWKDQLLVFDNETLEEIALKMSRWYKVRVDILDSKLKLQRYTGKFVNNESLDQVLEAINLTTPIQYNVSQNSVQIRSKLKNIK